MGEDTHGLALPGPPNCLGISPHTGPDGIRMYRRDAAERLMGIKPGSLRKRDGVPLIDNNGETFVEAGWVEEVREEKLKALGVADVARQAPAALGHHAPEAETVDALQQRVAALEGEVLQCVSELRRLGAAAEIYKDLYFGRLPLGALND